jgi:hypothetical protein
VLALVCERLEYFYPPLHKLYLKVLILRTYCLVFAVKLGSTVVRVLADVKKLGTSFYLKFQIRKSVDLLSQAVVGLYFYPVKRCKCLFLRKFGRCRVWREWFAARSHDSPPSETTLEQLGFEVR